MKENKELINEKYMDWVQEYLKDKPGFSSDFYEFNRENAEEQDIKNVEDLEYFFRLTEEYANRNNIKPSTTEGNTFLIKRYYITYKNKTYDIGYISDQSTIFTFSEVLTKKNIKPIKFQEIENFQQKLRQKVHNITNIKPKQKTKVR